MFGKGHRGLVVVVVVVVLLVKLLFEILTYCEIASNRGLIDTVFGVRVRTSRPLFTTEKRLGNRVA